MENGTDELNIFQLVPQVLESFIQTTLGLVLVEMRADAERPELPFATYDVIKSYIAQSQNHDISDGFSMQIQLGIHGNSENATRFSALKLKTALERFLDRENLKSQGVAIERVLDLYDRPTLVIGQAYEYVSGIDLQIGVDPQFLPEDTGQITNLGVTAQGGGTIVI